MNKNGQIKIKTKVKKKKFKIKRIFRCLLILAILILVFLYLKSIPIKNIYIIGNNIIPDKEIITISGLDNYPSFFSTSKNKIIKKLLKNEYISKVEIKKKLPSKIYIYITENKVLARYNNNLLLEDFTTIENKYNYLDCPIITNNIDGIKDKFIKYFNKVDDDILLEISEIEYANNEVDNERFILRMNDGNMVYITLTKVEKINKYNEIYTKLEGKKGIIYLDSGDYVEVKD